ncbi:phosphotransferase family protein [Promicromonospora sp. NPDC052451]|uniref:phosphotransferase family protein n=1 Tax=Promicromonospora sp. NPDC052451 TaxID=3364407 RepID=UPI0037C4F25F
MRHSPHEDPRLAGRTLEPLAGGWSGETFLAVPAAAGGEPLVARYLAAAHHAPQAAGIQAALLRQVRGLLPVPEVHGAYDGDGPVPGLLLTELLPGERGDLVLGRLVTAARYDDLRTLGRALGGVAGTLAGVRMPEVGLFADATLRIEPFRLRLPGWVDDHARGLAAAGWFAAETAALRAVAERVGPALEGAPPCLVHSDLNPKNLLVDPVALRVTGVLDWEYAHAGHPATDLGNLLRFDREPAYVEGVLEGWCAAVGRATGSRPDPAAATDLARAADLVALVELAARPVTTPVVRRAREHLRAIARTEDVHAVP